MSDRNQEDYDEDPNAARDAKLNTPGYEGSKWYAWAGQSLDKQNRTLAKIILFQMVIVALLIVALIVISLSAPKPTYFASTPDLRVVPLTPMNEPFINDEAVINFSAKTVTQAMSLDFKRWKESLMNVKPSFSDSGFKEFTAALKSSGNLTAIQQKRLIAVAVLDGAPVITAQGVLQGIYAWKLTVPILVEYEGSQGVTNKQVLDADIIVTRVDVREKSQGVHVHKLNFKPRRE